MFKKILIANRGEIAVRIIRTCRDMDIASVAVYEESDCGSLHVLLADECIKLETARGYTDPGKMVEIALARSCDAIHPGYGFLAESSDFARACSAAGLTFIGPAAKTLDLCSSKITLLKLAKDCDVPLPLCSESAYSPESQQDIEESAQKLGYPVFVKAARGSNVRATRYAANREALASSVRRSAREAERLFGDKQVYLEKAILPTRTILLPFLTNTDAETVFLGSIDVSLARHDNRIFCESPAAGLKNEKDLQADALKIIKRLNYKGLGAVEFLLDKNAAHYFLGIQARLQIEHPLVELLYGLDLVQEQIEIAAGIAKRAPLRQAEGTAMQCRIYAADLLRGSLPSPGVLSRFRMPGGPHVRVDAFGYGGCSIPLQFDPLLATFASWGRTREECLHRMRRALQDTAISGIKTNIARIQSLLYDSDFVSANYNGNTAIHLKGLCISSKNNAELAAVAALAFKLRSQRSGQHKPQRLAGGWHASIHSFND